MQRERLAPQNLQSFAHPTHAETDRYGPETEKLVIEALDRGRWSAGRWKAWREERFGPHSHVSSQYQWDDREAAIVVPEKASRARTMPNRSLKTHQKLGVTLALKGIVGLNCGRNWLPHRTQGTAEPV